MIDLNVIEQAARKPWYCRSQQEDDLLSPAALDLVTRLRQAENDASRYRWLRDQCCGDWEVDGVEVSHIEVTMWINNGLDDLNHGESLHGAEMDSAIDKAMNARNGGYL